uniref:Uncharacterized protein n=1 Tax=viral metagenome TaxID=1070528 RepID=A0A6C0JEB4_9ZZZZ
MNLENLITEGYLTKKGLRTIRLFDSTKMQIPILDGKKRENSFRKRHYLHHFG